MKCHKNSIIHEQQEYGAAAIARHTCTRIPLPRYIFMVCIVAVRMVLRMQVIIYDIIIFYVPGCTLHIIPPPITTIVRGGKKKLHYIKRTSLVSIGRSRSVHWGVAGVDAHVHLCPVVG